MCTRDLSSFMRYKFVEHVTNECKSRRYQIRAYLVVEGTQVDWAWGPWYWPVNQIGFWLDVICMMWSSICSSFEQWAVFKPIFSDHSLRTSSHSQERLSIMPEVCKCRIGFTVECATTSSLSSFLRDHLYIPQTLLPKANLSVTPLSGHVQCWDDMIP